jgi:serine/threonine-protein kinase RsbW
MDTVALTRAEDKAKLADALQDFAQSHQLPPAALNAIDLALEEHLTNIFNYGFANGGQPKVLVQLQKREGNFIVEVSDNGKAFNPLSQPQPDVNKPLQDRPIGGLGIHLMRKFTDELTYKRTADRNILTMRKRLVG